MEPIRMVDLVSQHNRLRKELNIALNKVIDDASFIHGPEVGRFEEALAAYLKTPHVISCANGTDALKIALMALDLPRGSEVIMPAFTFVAPAEVCALLGLKPVFADIDPHNYNLDANQIEGLLTDNTRAIIPVHLFGQSADMETILRIAEKYDLYVIEDTAQALGTVYSFSDGKKQKAGTMGDIGCTSFFPAKNLGCFGDGGAIFTQNTELAQKIRMIKNHGQPSGSYYYETIGLNSRLDSIQAAILNVKLPLLDKFNESRQRVADQYDTAFLNNSNITIPHREQQSSHIFHQYTLQVHNGKRDKLQQYLNEHNIPSKIYYPEPLHKHKPYSDVSRVSGEGLPNTEKLASIVLSLPVHTEMDEAQMQYITSTVNRFFADE